VATGYPFAEKTAWAGRHARTSRISRGVSFVIFAVLVAAGFAGLAGCGGKGSGSGSSTTAITGLTPASGMVGAAVTITGTGFGASQLSNSSVTFNGTAATPIAWSATSIVVNVPTGAATGNVLVVAGGAASAGVNFTVTSGTPAACGTGSEAILSGSYAFSLAGFQGGGVGNYFARVGSFAADGAGHITIGEEDLNVSTAGDDHHFIAATGSSYSVGPDYRGCLTLAFADGTATFRFSLGALNGSNQATRGHLIEFDDLSGAGERGSGNLLRQDTTAFKSTALLSNYAFGMGGFDHVGGHVGEAGTFTLTPATGTISAGFFDYNDAGSVPYGTAGTAGTSTGTLLTAGSNISASTGRTTATFTAEPACGASCTYHWAVYIVNANQFFLMSSDTLGTNTPITSGRAISTTTAFNAGALTNSAGYIVEASGATASGSATVELEKLAFSFPNVTGTQFTYGLSSSPAAAQNTVGTTFTTAANGRFTLGIGSNSQVVYLTDPTVAAAIAGFVVRGSGDNNANEGLLVAAQSALFSPAGNGRYFLGTVISGDATVKNQVGVAGVISGNGGQSDTIGGAKDQSAPSGLSSFTFSNTLSLSAGISSGSNGAGGTIIAIADGTTLFFIDESGAAGSAAIFVVEQ
jgi:IPT/TIG domain